MLKFFITFEFFFFFFSIRRFDFVSESFVFFSGKSGTGSFIFTSWRIVHMESVKKFTKGRFFRFGLPFITLVVGGSFLLKEFASVRYTTRKSVMKTPEEIEKETGVKARKEKVSLESIYEDVKKTDLDNWENIRGPRPWEDSKSVQDEQRKNLNLAG